MAPFSFSVVSPSYTFRITTNSIRPLEHFSGISTAIRGYDPSVVVTRTVSGTLEEPPASLTPDLYVSLVPREKRGGGHGLPHPFLA